jgi:hypothetical protein
VTREERARQTLVDGPTLVLVLVLPFLVFSWMAPFVGANTIGRDYLVYSFGNQLELQLALGSGEWPVFVPGFAGGAPAPALMLGQLYHPLSHLAAALPGYWSGLALEWNTALRLLSLGLTQLALLAFLRHLGFARALAFGVSFVTVYNLRLLDLFRYGAALEGYTAMLLLCTSLAWHIARPTPRLGPAAIALATALLIVSGHPQVSFYGLLAAGIVWCFAPSLVRAVAPELATDSHRARLGAAAAVAVGFAIATVFWLPLAVEFLAENAARVGQTYRWSTSLQDDALGLARGFALPLRGDVHGAFAGSVLTLVALLVPFFAGRSMPRPLWALFAASWVVMLYALGDATPVHRWVWTLLPGQSSIRVPGRATQLLPVFFFWILAWRFRPSQPPIAFRGRNLHAAVWPVLAAVLVSLVLAAALWSQPASPFAPVRIREVPDAVSWLVLGSGALAALALTIALASHPRGRVAEPVFLVR